MLFNRPSSSVENYARKETKQNEKMKLIIIFIQIKRMKKKKKQIKYVCINKNGMELKIETLKYQFINRSDRAMHGM